MARPKLSAPVAASSSEMARSCSAIASRVSPRRAMTWPRLTSGTTEIRVVLPVGRLEDGQGLLVRRLRALEIAQLRHHRAGRALHEAHVRVARPVRGAVGVQRGAEGDQRLLVAAGLAREQSLELERVGGESPARAGALDQRLALTQPALPLVLPAHLDPGQVGERQGGVGRGGLGAGAGGGVERGGERTLRGAGVVHRDLRLAEPQQRAGLDRAVADRARGVGNPPGRRDALAVLAGQAERAGRGQIAPQLVNLGGGRGGRRGDPRGQHAGRVALAGRRQVVDRVERAADNGGVGAREQAGQRGELLALAVETAGAQVEHLV